MIMALILNFPARLTLLNPQKESKQNSDNIVTSGALLSINYDRIVKFNLVILPFKFINSVKYFIVSFILYSWKETFQL